LQQNGIAMNGNHNLIELSDALRWQDIAQVATGSTLVLSEKAIERVVRARAIVDVLVEKEIRGYGINTGVGALCDEVIDRADQQRLSRNILLSHSCGVGAMLDQEETRAVMAAQIANLSHGYSGVRPQTLNALLALLNANILPRIPSKGSVGYLTHAAAIGLVLIGEGEALVDGQVVSGQEAMRRVGLESLILEAKEGLLLVNGTPCATGLASIALARLERLLDWADAAAAMTYEMLGAQDAPFAPVPLALRKSAGSAKVGERLRWLLEGSAFLAASAGSRTQDPLSLRAVPQIHGAIHDVHTDVGRIVDNELASVTDNPVVSGTPERPEVHSQAHAVGAALGLAMDNLATASAELAAISERRIDRLVNPLVSGLPGFLAEPGGVSSGFMIIQYTAVSLTAENRRLAAPASLDGGITSALQEDILTHATPAADKALAILSNLETILAIELLAAAQARDMQSGTAAKSKRTAALHDQIRDIAPVYRDDRPLNQLVVAVRDFLRKNRAPFLS
jgi:histidine ammonia-lyase